MLYHKASLTLPHTFLGKDNHSIRLPAFTGIEKWEVWYHRFEAVAELKGWDETDKLQELLPRLQESWQSYRVIIFSFASKYSTGVYTVAV
jgi:hypothetical protein